MKTFYFLHSTFYFRRLRRRGMFLPVILMISVLFMAYSLAIVTMALSNVKIANLHNKKITAMAISEAGINYYMWHLAHANGDFCDGQPCSGSVPYGPYQHEYTDEGGTVLGTYDLFITPPQPGKATTIVKSVGKVNGKSPAKTVVAELGMPSLTKYSLLVNSEELWVGLGERIDGTVHINNSGVYNQGEITKDVSSTELTYNGIFGQQPGVAGPGVFGGAKMFPVPPIDFNKITVDIAKMRNEARDKGEGDYYDSSGQKGYHIILKDNAYDLYSVKKFDSIALDITQENLVGTYSYPAEGMIVLEDNVWVEGTINNHQLTIVAADPEANNNQLKRIIIPNLIKYTHYDGTDKLGLITQTDVLVSKNAPYDMEINAAMIAKNGEIRIDNFGLIKGSMRVYGSMAHNTGLVWTYATTAGQVVSGYRTTETILDPYNVSNPPPKFPTTGAYSILSWREE